MGMFQALIDALRTPDLRNKILFTLGMILVFRFLAHVPLPGVNQDQLNTLLQNNQLINLLDLFSGGGLARFSIVALGVNPYINASIIMTLLNQTIPALERLSKEGEYGRNKINQYTRVLTVPLALLQGIGVAVFMQRQGVLNAFGPSDLAPTLSILASLTAGTIILMWLGELISERGIGNGISFIIFAGIVGRLPNTVEQTLQVQQNALALGSIAVIAVLVIAAIIFIQEGQRRIPVQYAKRVRGPDLLQHLVLHPRRGVHVLLHRVHVRAERRCRQHQAVRRLHTRHPAWTPDGRVPIACGDAHHDRRGALPRVCGGHADPHRRHHVGADAAARWHEHPDRRRRGRRNDEAA